MLLFAVAVLAACQKTEVEDDLMLKKAVADDGVELVGAHYNLNIIATKDKTMPDDIAAGHVIFVKLGEADNPKTSDELQTTLPNMSPKAIPETPFNID